MHKLMQREKVAQKLARLYWGEFTHLSHAMPYQMC